MKALSEEERWRNDWLPQNEPLDQIELWNHNAPHLTECSLWFWSTVLYFLLCFFAANPVNAGFLCGSVIDPFLFSQTYIYLRHRSTPDLYFQFPQWVTGGFLLGLIFKSLRSHSLGCPPLGTSNSTCPKRNSASSTWLNLQFCHSQWISPTFSLSLFSLPHTLQTANLAFQPLFTMKSL